MKYNVEITDTFGGEANYSWVRRYSFEAPDAASNRMLMRRAGRVSGTVGAWRTPSEVGDCLTADAVGACIVMFITPEGY